MNQDRIQLLRDSGNIQIAPESRGYESLGNPIQDNVRPEEFEASQKFPQYIATITATLSALCAGTVLGWTSPIMQVIEDGKYHDISVDTNQMGWIGSFVTLGAMTMCFPTGFVCDLIGRKKTLLTLIIPFIIGWLLILFANSVIMLYFGRLISGMAVGACCVAATLYINEISEKNNRGTLGSYFQLMITVGIFVAYFVGKFLSPMHYTILCAVLPVVFVALFSFQPETPVYLLKKGLYEQARRNLIRLRGRDYDVNAELMELEGMLKESGQTATSIAQTFHRKSNLKALYISFPLMFFQQFSGINAVILYNSDIFNASGIKLDGNTAAILVGAFQAFATFISSLLVDRLGRRVLLFVSCLIMGVSNLTLAIFFTLKTRASIDPHVIEELGFMPVLALCTLVIFFSFGLGPIPWLLSAEIFPPEVKSIASSAAGTFNWFLAFLITKFYLQISDSVGQDTTFYIFSILTFLGTGFVYFILPETKGKSIEEIQFILNN